MVSVVAFLVPVTPMWLGVPKLKVHDVASWVPATLASVLLLPVKDSIELGLSAADDTVADADKLREGLELTLKLFNTASEKFGLAELNPEGESFDPEYHQAMSMQEVAGVESGSIITVVQKGYILNDRLLRPAMVIVAK